MVSLVPQKNLFTVNYFRFCQVKTFYEALVVMAMVVGEKKFRDMNTVILPSTKT